MKRFFLFWFVFLLSTVSYAEITDVRGVWDSGGTVIIDGFGFGQKAQPAPVVWDDLEDGLSNTSASIGGWASVNSLGISTAQQRHPSSNYSAHHNFVSEATAGFRGNSSPVSQKWFVQYWFYLDPNFDWGTSAYGAGDQFLANVKIFRLWSPGSTSENFVMATRYPLGSEVFAVPENVAGQTSVSTNGLTKNSMTKGVWHQLQFEFQDSSSAGSSDGEFRVWLDGRQVMDMSGFVGRTDGSYKRPYIIGFYNSWSAGSDSAGSQAPNDFYMDDVYVDTSWNRVEVCEGSTWADKGQCEIQIPTFWSDSSISVTVNTGAFATGETAYLYVVDDGGIVHGAASPVVMGESQADSVDSAASYDYGEISLQQSSYTVERSAGYVYLTVSRLNGSDGAVSVQWSSNGLTALHDVDYYGADNQSIYFAQGETSKQIAIELIQNNASDDRVFNVSLSNVGGGADFG